MSTAENGHSTDGRVPEKQVKITKMAYDKALIASNIQFLRNGSGMTQLELAERLNYSDKAVSKWERGASVPDVFVLKQMADIFGVSVDFFFEEHCEDEKTNTGIEQQRRYKNKKHLIIALISVAGLWCGATAGYFIVRILTDVEKMWLLFPACVPASMVLLLVFNQIWGKKKYNVYIISVLLWSLLAVFVAAFYGMNHNVWMLMFIGIPAEIVTILSCRLESKSKKKTGNQ